MNHGPITMKLKIGLTYDLRRDYLALGYPEEEVAEFDSEATIEALAEAIRGLGHAPERIGNVRALCARLAAGSRWDLVFNIAEGRNGRGRESQVPCLLDAYDVAYTFSDPLSCAVTLDKAVAKRLLQAAGLHTARFAVVAAPAELERIELGYPLFAKPIAEGTGKGISSASLVETPEQLRSLCVSLLERFGQPVLVEEFLPGREFTVGLLGTGPRARVLGTMEVIIRKHANTVIYSYEVKEKCEDLVDYRRPERTPLIAAVEQLALDAYRALELRDGARLDLRIDRAGLPAFIEANPLPGLHPQHSDLPMIATQEGLPYGEMIGAIVSSALERRRA
jgi:D-alanine-D-alanine ligase